MLNQSRSEMHDSNGLCLASVHRAPIVSTIEMGNSSDSGPTSQALSVPGDRENIIMTKGHQQHSSSSFRIAKVARHQLAQHTDIQSPRPRR